MRKRRIRIKPRFWVFLSILIALSVISLSNCNLVKNLKFLTEEETVEIQEEYILSIPLDVELQKELYEASNEFGVDYYVMVALVERETNFSNISGDSGDSYGYCQIQPKWWYGLMTEIGATDLNIPKDNFRVACAIISKLMNKHDSIEGALVEYNQGYYNGSSTSYSRWIMENAQRYKA